MGRTGNMIIKDCLRQMCVPIENSAYFGDGGGFNSNPGCKFLTRHYVEFLINELGVI